MKRTVVFLASLFIVAILASSCAVSRDCAAYGETSKYQKSNSR